MAEDTPPKRSLSPEIHAAFLQKLAAPNKIVRQRHIKRNAVCPCGSGKKFKNCHGRRGHRRAKSRRTPADELRRAANGLKDHAPEENRKAVLGAMQRAGVDPALIYAFDKTGILVNEVNRATFKDEDLKEWDDAIAEFDTQAEESAEPENTEDKE